MSLPIKIAWSLLSVLVALAYGLLAAGIVRKIMARIQGRIGPPVYQPFIDLVKLFVQRTATRHGVMYYLAPSFRFTGGVGLYLIIPVVVGVPALSGFSFSGDLLLVIYFMFFGCLGMALGAGNSGHPNSAIAVTRGLSQMSAYELPFSLAVVAMAAQVGSFSLTEIVAAQQGGVLQWNLFANPLAAFAAFIAMLGMNMYSPFNIVLAPQEIPIGPPTEFNSSFLGMMTVGRALYTVAKLVLFMNLFLGGAASIPMAFAKTFVIYLWSIFVGAVFPRLRTEQSVRFFLGWPTVAGAAAVVLVILTR